MTAFLGKAVGRRGTDMALNLRVVRINFTEMEGGPYNEDLTDVVYLSINPEYINTIRELYNCWNTMWNGGDSYENYSEYAHEWGTNNDFVRRNFEEFKEMLDKWSVKSFVKIINRFFPKANASIITPADVVDLRW